LRIIQTALAHGAILMNWRAILFSIVVLVLLLVAMFYSGMFMHGDPS